ncbi:MAG: enoyl-CoA hydratase [Xanthobacteraceae bacterium]|nr:MAG: enoyl-CoA hydratase [Xanthobacteraceae bacterium]
MTDYTDILVERKDAVGLVRLNRPKMLNALSFSVLQQIAAAIDEFEADEAIGCIVITGSDKAFAAGADIKEMQPKGYAEMFKADFISAARGTRVASCRKPTIAAVAGFALGGGCELAMMCDMIIAADTAKFGQPEINLGTLPGLGGTQRLIRAVGKSKAMDMCLTARMMDAAEAERSGLVTRVFPADRLMEEVMAIAAKIAANSQIASMMVKEAINHAMEMPLAEGLEYERARFQSSFALEDRSEGMAAFVEKRPAKFTNR